MATTVRNAKPLHELLLEHGALKPEQLQQAQAEAAKTGEPLKRVIVRRGLMGEEDLSALVAAQSGVTAVDLSNYLIKPEVIQLAPEALARRHTLIPVFKIGDSLTVAMEDPLNFFAVDELRLKTQCEIKTVVASETSIRQAIDQYYGSSGTIAEVAQAIKEAELPKKDEEAAGEAPIIRLVNLLIMQAVKERASDIHIEPGDGTLRTRFRVDGVLQEVNGSPPHLHSAVVSRIKVLAKLDIAEKRKPQDGRFQLKMEGKDIDLRVSVVPGQFGEKVVMRLLDSAGMRLSLKELGLDEQTRTQLERLIHVPHGILLVTGPTGSGKTTTLYAALSLINEVCRNIITIEDPVEYHLAGIHQVQVNPKADVTFASALRAFLRQDPNVIMVGEIRDRETAEIAIQAALTGHLVLSTLHTNDAPSSLTRLIDMGVEPFLIASSVVGILAQRLVRVICPKCKESYKPATSVTNELGLKPDVQLFHGKGCSSCKQSGYKGRVGLFELLMMTEPIKNGVVSKSPAHTIREAGQRAGMRTLREDGLNKALAGVTTVEEVLRVTQLE
ncbi:MAG: type II secretion system ATPase GspE [Candidatus Omnitrophica bacterium]|nr:type II secretion system ATPase GspE [Candidatus Omnitrophota bacterium]